MRHILIGAIIVGAALAGWAGEATRSAMEPGAVVEQIRRLGDQSGEVRAGAVSRLVRMGKEALPELVRALGAEGEEERAAAAEAIRKILANDPAATADGRHDRAFWEKRLGQVRAGMSWDEAMAALFPEMTAAERGNVRAGGVGDSFAAVRVVRLDGYWSAQIYVRGTRDSTVTRPPMLSGRTASVFVQAPAGYTGVWTTWYVNGQKASETNYRDGRRDGTVTRYFTDGVSKSSETTYVQGVSSGPYRGWFQSGRESVVGSFKDSRRDGRWTMWYENGQVRSVEEFKDGQRHGLSARWYESGQKESEEHYADGRKDGLDCSWDQAGKQLWQRVYRDGRVIENQPIARPKAAAEEPAPPVAEPPPQRGATVSEIEARMRERRGRDLAIERFQRMGVEPGIDRTRPGSPVVSLDLSHKDISDFDLTYVAMLPQLERLNVSATRITDAGLKHLRGLSGLETLHLSGTQVTDAGLEHLKNLSHLKMVMVLGTSVTQEGAAELRRVLPNVIVGGARRGATPAPAVDPDVQEIERRIRERRMRELMPEAAPVPATRPAGDGGRDTQDEILKRMRERRAEEGARDAAPATRPSGDMRRDGEDELLRRMRERRAREMRGEMSATADDEFLRQHLSKGTEAGATTQPASAAADLRAFRERLMTQAAELKRPEEGQVFIQRLLGEYGARFSVSFTIEVDRRDTEKFPPISTLYVWPEDVKNVEGLIEFVRRTLPEMEVARDVEQARVIHLIAKSLLKEEGYAMGRRISIRYKGTPSGLLGELEERSGGLVAAPRGGLIGEPMGDHRTKIEVDAAGLPYRSILSDWLPFAEYRPILWIAEARVVDGKLVAGVKFQGPREWPTDAWGPVTGGVRLGIIVDHAVWTNDRPIRISAILQNMRQTKIDVPHMALMGMLQIELKLPDGKPAPLTLEGKRYEQMAGLWTNAASGLLKPGETETTEIPLSRLFDMSLEGTYKVVVRRRIDANLTVSSAEVAIRVEDADRGRELPPGR